MQQVKVAAFPWVALVVLVISPRALDAQDQGRPGTGLRGDPPARAEGPRGFHVVRVAASDAPRVVEVHPPAGAKEVEPVTEIRIRFDRPMNPARLSLKWDGDEGGFLPRGDVRYVADTREFVIPVRLASGVKHQIAAGKKHPFEPDRFEGFESTEHVASKPLTWSFTTAKPAAGKGPAPRVVSVVPPSDSEVALLSLLEVTFDRPMDPASFGFEDADPRDLLGGPDRMPGLGNRVDYDPARRRFTIQVHLPPNWNGAVVLKGFRSQEGAEAAPTVLNYRTRRQILSKALRDKVEGDAPPSEALRQLIDKVRERRRIITSVSEEVVATSWSGMGSPTWYQSWETKGARFRMDGDRKFSAEVDAIMGIPFRVGSDGVHCWWRARETQSIVPFEKIEEKNVLICDPFAANRAVDANEIIRGGKLEYLGEAVVRGARCHRIRSWYLGPEMAKHAPGMVRDWYIDALTFLPARVETQSPNRWTSADDFTYSRINQPIPEDQLRITKDEGVRDVELEPLDDDYTLHFLNVIDGSNGRMSVRWGKRGPKGMSSSGLN